MKSLSVLQHLFVPHHTNNHRAKALQIDAMFVYALVFVLFNVVTKVMSIAYPDILGYATNIQVEQLLAETNARRQAEGIPPLVLNQQLSEAAAGKAADMFGNDYWAHVSPKGKTPWDFIVGAGYRYSVAGENLAKNFQDSSGVVNAWMNSPTHRENLLKSNYKEVGFAVVNGRLQGEETTLVVQMFGTRPATRIVEAVEPSPAAAIAAAPAAVEEVAAIVPQSESAGIAANPVIVSEVASITETQPAQTWLQSFSSVIINPRFDIVSLRKDVSVLFAGVLIGIFLLDFYLAMRKRSVRAVGSSIAHIFFFAMILVSMNMVTRGSLI